MFQIDCRILTSPWGNEDTQTLIDILGKYNVRATFFVVGEWVDKYPESVQALHAAGHEIMNHSSDHAHFNSLSAEEIIADLNACNEKIKAITGTCPTLFRCPYGEYDDIRLTVILVGTSELLDLKRGFVAAGKQQIILRFMLNGADFRGIETSSDMYVCMASLDKDIIVPGEAEPLRLMEAYFPDAYMDGKRLVSFVPDFWTAMQNLRVKNRIKNEYLTMKCFMDTVLYCLRKFGAQAGEGRVYAPSVAEWEISLIASAYVSSQVV